MFIVNYNYYLHLLKLFNYTIITFIIFNTGIICAQEQSPISNYRFADSTKSSKNNFRKYTPYVIAGAIGAGVFAFDKSLNEFSQKSKYHSPRADDFFEPLGDYGHFGPYLIATPLLAGYGVAFDNDHCLRTSGELLVGLAAAELVTGGVKLTLGRKRPHESDDAYDFFKDGYSFWSGHTIAVFTFATVASKRFPRQNLSFIGLDHDLPIVPVLAYSYAGLIGIQRLYANDHWASDVYFGAIAGYAIGTITVRLSDKLKSGKLKLKAGRHVYLIYELPFG
jgi:membrane-associated phospholipid phosphatase